MDHGQQREVELAVKGMTCDACVGHVRSALEDVAGAELVEVPGWRDGRARIVGTASASQLAAAATAAGYPATPIEQPAVPAAQPRSSGAGDRYDLAVIGTGAGGMAAAIKAAELGARVAIIEAGTIGGTCVNIGCVPSKTLIRAADAYHAAGHHGFAGVHTTASRVDWAAVVAQKDELVAQLREHKYVDVLRAYEQHIRVIQGRARLTGDGRVLVDADKPLELHANQVIVATGAQPFIPPIDGIGEVEVLTSQTAMELTALPKSLVVIGGRAIALELGQAFARLGTAVTIVQRSERLLPDHEPETSAEIARQLRREGVEVVTGATPKAVLKRSGAIELTIAANGESRLVRAQHLLAATGVRPRTAELGLQNAGVRSDAHGFIEVDAALRTSNPQVLAVGDVTTLPKLVYLAAASGSLAASNAVGGRAEQLDLRGMPDVVFTDPQVARVGLTEEAARAAGHQVKATALRLEHVPRALTSRDTRGGIKLVADSATDQLLGAHVVAAEGGEIIQIAALAIKFGITVRQLTGSMFAYLTQAEGLKLAAQTFDKDLALLSCCAA